MNPGTFNELLGALPKRYAYSLIGIYYSVTEALLNIKLSNNLND